MNVLTREQSSAFDEDGFVVLRGLLDPAIDLDPVILEYEGVLERLARRLVETGEIASTHEGVPFGRRLSQIYLEARRVFAGHFDCTLSMVSVSADSPIWVGPDPTRSAPNVTCRNGGWRHPWGTNKKQGSARKLKSIANPCHVTT